jgi:hypothetical protein
MKSPFDVDHFKNLTYSVLLNNATSQTEVGDSSKIRLVEFIDKGLSLLVPKNVCAQGHLVALTIIPNKKNIIVKKIRPDAFPDSIRLSGKVTSLEPASESSCVIGVEFDQKTEEPWNRFIELFASKQTEINRLVKAIKE